MPRWIALALLVLGALALDPARAAAQTVPPNDASPADPNATPPGIAQDGDTPPPDSDREATKQNREKAMESLVDDANQGDDVRQVIVPVGGTTPTADRSGSLLRFEHHGYFRFRGDLFLNLDLDTRGTSPVPPPFGSRERTGQFDGTGQTGNDSDTLTSANMRFRYAPTLHIKDHLRINATIDILDNIVLGSTPDGLRGADPDTPLNGLTGSTEQPTFETVGKDAINVRALYGEFEAVFGVFRVGRMPNHWGLGMVNNDGGSNNPHRSEIIPNGRDWQCIDCDFGDFIDRLEIMSRDPFLDLFYASFGWDWPSTGIASYNANAPGRFTGSSATGPYAGTSFGQPIDLAQADDTFQLTFRVFDKPISNQEIARRRDALLEARAPVFDWGVQLIYRSQGEGLATNADAINMGESPELGNSVQMGNSTGGGATNPENPTGAIAQDQNVPLRLVPRDIEIFIPDVWGRMLWSFGRKQHLRLEAEFAMVAGSIEAAVFDEQNVNVDQLRTVNRDILQFGGAIEAELRLRELFVGFNTGFATSDNNYGFGYLDVDKVTQTTNPVTGADISTSDLTGFQFNRNYLIDLIMFRELVGGITNAIYFDPNISYQVEADNDRSTTIIGGRLDLITAFALDEGSTPGQDIWYGFEADLRIFYEEPDDYRMELATGLLIPGAVWQMRRDEQVQIPAGIYTERVAGDPSRDPNIAWTFQGNFYWLF